MLTLDRTDAERQFHDAQAADRAAEFAAGRADLRFADADYLDHETWVRPAFARLGDLRGRAALDYGCGHGMAAVVLARGGADVTAFDLSPGYVAEAERRAAVNGVPARFVVADGERLPFPDASFDVVWGHAVLHHLDPDAAGRELRRVLKPGGRAVFCEPWGGNPVLDFARRRLPYPGKHRTADEKPLTPADVAGLRVHFPNLTVEPHQFLGMVRRVCRWPPLLARLDAADRRLFRTAPSFGKWCRYVVLELPRE
jgi:SAM-dependent methyltransferase